MKMTRLRWVATLSAAAAPIALIATTPAVAAQQAVYSFDIPAQDLDKALARFGKTTRAQLVFDGRQVRGARSQAVRGTYSASEALERLLRGTGFGGRMTASGVFVIEPAGGRSVQLQADSAPDPQEGTSSQAEIIVTGSRLKSTFDSAIPTAEVNRDELLEGGYTDIAEAIVDVPGVDTSSNLANNQSSIQGSGLSTISLRGLGSNRSLTLIDGRRTVSNAGYANVVSLSTIPEYFVERVDISTGGASAIYGSDAVAGVVNVITSRFEGGRARVVGGATWDGGGDNFEVSAGYGKRLLDDRLYVMGGITYEKQYRLAAVDRDFAVDSVRYDFANNELVRPNPSSNIPGGRYNASNQYFYYDEDGLHRNFSTTRNGYEYRRNGTIITPRETLAAAGKLEYSFNDSLKFVAQYLYSRVVTNSVAEPEDVNYASTYGRNDEFEVGRIRVSNPYVPEEIRDEATSSTIRFYRRMTEVGERHRYNRRVTNRAWAGFEGKLFDNAWDWSLIYGFGEYDQFQNRTNYLNLENLHNALRATRDIDGTIICSDADARAEGCVPINLFGIGAVTPEAADYIRADSLFYAHNRLDTVEGYMTGPLLDLPAGPVQTAVGFSWRREKTSSSTDPVTQTGASSASYIPEFTGKIEAKEAFLEIGVPLLRDVPFAHRLSLDGAVRIADYSIKGVGTTVSFKGGAQWEPTPGLKFRGTYSRANRAPDTTELFSPLADDYDTVIDICDGVGAATAGTVAQNCRANPGIAAAITASPDGTFQQDSTSVFGPSSGNPNLHEERADTLTVGLVVQPRFLPGFTLSADYYDIRIKDAISSLSNNKLLLECYSDPAGADNRFCDTITRNSDGQIVRIINQEENLDQLRAEGIDVTAEWRAGLGGIGLPGEIRLQGRYTHRLKLETRFVGISGTDSEDYVGEVGVSRNEAKISAEWRGKAISLTWSARYLGPTVDSHERVEYFRDNGVTDPLILNIPAYWRHDFSFKITPMPRKPYLRLFGTVRNVFDDHGPFLPTGADSGSVYNYSSVYDVRGRTFFLGLETRF